jgi:hypothetical protein
MTTRQEQVREAITKHRKRRRRGLFWRPITVTKDQLDQLEERGYLDPDRRGERADETEAIETFLMDTLVRPQAVAVQYLDSIVPYDRHRLLT